MVYIQEVLSQRRRVLVERYLTPKGKRLLAEAKTRREKNLIWDKYGKNRYRNNPEAKVLYGIKHR